MRVPGLGRQGVFLFFQIYLYLSSTFHTSFYFSAFPGYRQKMLFFRYSIFAVANFSSPEILVFLNFSFLYYWSSGVGGLLLV